MTRKKPVDRLLHALSRLYPKIKLKYLEEWVSKRSLAERAALLNSDRVRPTLLGIRKTRRELKKLSEGKHT